MSRQPSGEPRLSGPDLTVAARCVELSQLAYRTAKDGALRCRNAGYVDYRFIESRGGRDVAILVSEPNRHYLAFRGSDELKDWLTNLALWRTPTEMGRIHTGFLKTAEALLPSISTAIRSLAPGPIIFTGHSMGGALAPLCALSLSTSAEHPFSVYSFGQPSVGGISHARYVRSRKDVPYFRFVHGADAIAVWGMSEHLLAGTPCYFDHRGHLIVDRATLSRPKLGLYFHRMEQYRFLLRLNQMKQESERCDEAITQLDTRR